MKSDEELMCAAARGDPDAFDVIVRRHQQGTINVAWRLLGDSHGAQDAAQEAFLRVWERAAAYRPTASFKTYLYRILTRLCIDQHRKRRPAPSDQLDRLEGGVAAPDEALMQRERAAKVRAAIQALPQRQRVALVLRHYEGMSYDEVAAVMGCSARAVDSLLLRARERLGKRLGDIQ